MRFLAITIILITMLKPCSGDKDTYEGSLSLFGAEPFVQLALMTDDDERIFLEGDEKLLDKLWKENKGRIKIEGKLYESEWSGQPHPFLKIKEWEWV
ncbi:MAG: hypothetical protein WEB89_02400, partial [Balneolales bacterium]